MLRIVIAPLLTFALIAAALSTFLAFGTAENALLSPETIGKVTNAPAQDTMTLDDLLGASAPAEDPTVAELKQRQERVLRVLFWSMAYAIAIGLAFAIAWGFRARSLEPDAGSPQGQRGGFPSWLVLLVIYPIAYGCCFWFLAADPNIDPPNTVPYLVRLIAIIVAGMLGYWVATALAASRVMRPSVPLASILTRSKRS